MPEIARMTEKLLVGQVARIKSALRRAKQTAVDGKADSNLELDCQEVLPRPNQTVPIDDPNTDYNAPQSVRVGPRDLDPRMPSISPIFHVWEITVGRHKFLLSSNL